ncbi:MAG: hypothetical protein LUG55_08310 [Clostridiales bacterium]|nr:hypothetical protein [Clostridiales bacterium]
MTKKYVKDVLQEMLDTVNSFPDDADILAVDLGSVRRPTIQVWNSPAKYALPGEKAETRAVKNYPGDVVQIVERGKIDILRYISSGPTAGEVAK